MDWARAKSILILVFLTLNIFLLTYISIYRFGQGISRETITDTVQILGTKGIVLECEIPLYNDATPRLVYRNGRFNRERIVQKLMGIPGLSAEEISSSMELTAGDRKLVFTDENSFVFSDSAPAGSMDISGKDGTEKLLRGFLEDIGLKVTGFRLDGYIQNDDGSVTCIFTEKYKKFMVFDNYIRVVVSGNGVSRIECKYRNVKGFSQDKVKVMPAHLVLLKNFGYGENTTVTGISIGFKGYGAEQNVMEYSEGPAWRITVKGSRPRYFKASDGEEIK